MVASTLTHQPDPDIVCPKCGLRMQVAAIEPAGKDDRTVTFGCDCGHRYNLSERAIVALARDSSDRWWETDNRPRSRIGRKCQLAAPAPFSFCSVWPHTAHGLRLICDWLVFDARNAAPFAITAGITRASTVRELKHAALHATRTVHKYDAEDVLTAQ
jgi:hypothetical protein